MEMKLLSERVRHARKEAGLTQAEAARQIGVTREAFGQWESGQSKSIKSDNLHKAADTLCVDSRWLAVGESSPSVKKRNEGTLNELSPEERALIMECKSMKREDILSIITYAAFLRNRSDLPTKDDKQQS